MADDMKIKALFERYDTNKNGVLDREEFFVVFKQILSEMGENFPEKKNDEVAEEGMNNFDLNRNGTIEYDEFSELINFLINDKGYKLPQINLFFINNKLRNVKNYYYKMNFSNNY